MRIAPKFAASLFALAMMVGFSGTASAAEKVTIEGTVTGQDGKPAANVPVRLTKAMAKKSEPKAAAGEGKIVLVADKAADKGTDKAADKGADKGKGAGKAAPLAETTTDDKGEFKLTAELEPGDYAVMAGNRDAGQGREMVSIKAGEKPAKVSLTLRAAKKKQ